ncbi:hypothetical protein BDDG_12208 [Blastomyces dermatitidis ATCC 18188]|uniref:Uncharacterized protein n=1 Tax=Ajellomyces dermatitidis (strain ATCC 18188 / CBS 674.68) TaxID=653446 RepID=A0A0J9ER20_AJEDA|nr:hypothetical protein BDDG_12208 [Blastomyces dermatitidis ATCC 18188]
MISPVCSRPIFFTLYTRPLCTAMEEDGQTNRSGSRQPLHSAGPDESAGEQASREPTQVSDTGRAYSQVAAEKHAVMIAEVWQNAVQFAVPCLSSTSEHHSTGDQSGLWPQLRPSACSLIPY